MTKRILTVLALAALAACSPAQAEVATTPISTTSRQGVGNPMGVFGENLGSNTVFLTDNTTVGDRYPLLLVWGTGVCISCEANAYIVHWQGADDELSIDATRGTITDSCAVAGVCGNDGRGAGVYIPASQTICWRVIQASLRDTSKAGRRNGVCETSAGADLSGIDRGRPCAADADCREGALDNTNVCDTGGNAFERTRGTFLAGTGTCHGWWES